MSPNIMGEKSSPLQNAAPAIIGTSIHKKNWEVENEWEDHQNLFLTILQAGKPQPKMQKSSGPELLISSGKKISFTSTTHTHIKVDENGAWFARNAQTGKGFKDWMTFRTSPTPALSTPTVPNSFPM